MSESVDQLNAQAFDVFCSIGGLTYGLQKAGIKVNAVLDIDGSCRYAYETNCQATFVEADIKEISFSDISGYFNNADYRVLVGCAPCQPFSSLTSTMKAHELDLRWKLISLILLMKKILPHLVGRTLFRATHDLFS